MENFVVVNKGEVNKKIVIRGNAVTNKYIKHIMNHVTHVHDHKSCRPIMLSTYMDVEISENQLELFNTHPVDVLMGSIMQETIGH